MTAPCDRLSSQRDAMPVLYLVLLAGWLLLVGVVRPGLHHRRTGAVVARIADPVGAPQWWSRVLAACGLVLAVAAPLAALAGLDSFGALDCTEVAAAGAGLVVIGVTGTLVGQVALGDSWRADVDPDARTELVVNGPFRWIRNPIFSGTAVTTAGLALIVPNVLAAGMLVLFVASWQVQVRLVEEPYLARVHGGAYERYAGRTGRFLPGVGRLRAR
jgi:protein-S-isoprenylcysteine O-methyltransferase Ste14